MSTVGVTRKPLEPVESLFLVFLAISQVYYGYRYAFQYNSEGTSPTYQDTPFLFQAGKYVFASVLFACSLAILGVRNRTRISVTDGSLFILIAIGGFVAYSLVIDLLMIGDYSEFGDAKFLKAFFFFPILALLPFHYEGRNSLVRYFRVIVVFGMTYHIFYTLLQVASYFLFSRLPALGYAGGLVRFGGGWDDPNGFATFLSLPILVLVSGRFTNRATQYVGLLVLLTLLAMAISVTGLVGFASALICYCCLKRRFLLIVAVLAPVFAAVIGSSTLRALIVFAYEAKSGSVQDHIDQLSIGEFLRGSNIAELLLGHHQEGGLSNEFFWLALVQNYGVVGLVWLALMIGLTLANAFQKARIARRHKDLDGAEMFLILGSFLVGFCAAAGVTPSFYVFPVNLYFWLALFMIWLSPSPESTEIVSPPMLARRWRLRHATPTS